MRAIRVHAVGGPEQLLVEEMPTPEPSAGEARIRVAAAGVNFIDVYHRNGAIPQPCPFTPGMEAAGTVDAVGPGVEHVAVGDRVAHPFHLGAYAEHQIVPTQRLVGVPDGVELRTAAAVMLQGLTAHYLTRSTFPLREGQTALVHAGAGGLGLLLTQVANRIGANVLTTTSSEEKAARSRAAGASHVIRYDREDVAEAVSGLTDGRGVDVVYDTVGQSTALASLASVARRGMLVLIGESSGQIEPPLTPKQLKSAGSVFLTRPTLADHIHSREELTWRADELFGWLQRGELDAHVGAEHPLDQAGEAHRRLEARQTVGKALLVP